MGLIAIQLLFGTKTVENEFKQYNKDGGDKLIKARLEQLKSISLKNILNKMLEFEPGNRTNISETLKMLHDEEGDKEIKRKEIKEEEVKHDEVEVKREWKVKDYGDIWSYEELQKLDFTEIEKENNDWEIRLRIG